MSTAHLQGLGSLQLGYQIVPIVLHVVRLLPQVVPVQLHLVEVMLLLLNLPGLASLQSVHSQNWYIGHTASYGRHKCCCCSTIFWDQKMTSKCAA